MKNIFFVLLVSLFCMIIHAQEPVVEKSFLILYSGSNYDLAVNFAKRASIDLGSKLDLRSLSPDHGATVGLTSDLICGCGQKHGYIPRGRFDDGNYISIELSDFYQNFSPGFYIVVGSSGNEEEVTDVFRKVKEYYKDAYIKNTAVYIGCMH